MKKISYVIIFVLILLIVIGSILFYLKINENITGAAIDNESEEDDFEGDYAIIRIIEENEIQNEG